jgi:hypothetical protein
MKSPIHVPSKAALPSAVPPLAAPADAIGLLMTDHRQIEAWFREFQMTTSIRREEDLAAIIIHAIRAHADIDEHVFYPAYLHATHDARCHHLARVERAVMEDVIDEIEGLDSTDDFFFDGMRVLRVLFERHVRVEEKSCGTFVRAQHSPMDLHGVAAALGSRKAEWIALAPA